jgi:hypothetical protein
LIEILGLPLAVFVESAKPHDVQSARKFLHEQLDPKQPALPGLQAIVADRGCTGLAALAAQTWMEVACVAYLCGRLPIEPT